MSNASSEQILQYVAQSRNRAQKAERDFDDENLSIQRKADRNIDLFGGSATSQVVELASDSRRACDDLYSAYQMEVQLLDEACRPLLDSQPSLEAVKAVCTLIKWLNDESEIENNFTASLNSYDLGHVASAKYVPTMSNKMIQRYWEAKYDSWPGRAEEIAAEEENRRRAAAQLKLRKEEEKARQEEAARQKEIADKKARDAIAQRIAKKAEKLNESIQKLKQEMSSVEDEANKTISAEQDRLAAIQAERAQLGLFKFKEKQALAQEIAALQQQIQQRKDTLSQTQTTQKKEIDEINRKLTLISAKPKDEYIFGARYHPYYDLPMKWIVVKNDGINLLLLANETVECKAYWECDEWLNSSFIEKVFADKERSVLIPVKRGQKNNKVALPISSEVSACCESLGTSPEGGLIKSIQAEHIATGKKCGYNSRQIENGIAYDVDCATSYWLDTADEGRSGWANFVGEAVSGGWITSKIGAGAPHGVRPVICLDLNKLLDMI